MSKRQQSSKTAKWLFGAFGCVSKLTKLKKLNSFKSNMQLLDRLENKHHCMTRDNNNKQSGFTNPAYMYVYNDEHILQVLHLVMVLHSI